MEAHKTFSRMLMTKLRAKAVMSLRKNNKGDMLLYFNMV